MLFIQLIRIEAEIPMEEEMADPLHSAKPYISPDVLKSTEENNQNLPNAVPDKVVPRYENIFDLNWTLQYSVH